MTSIARWLTDRASTDPDLPAIKQSEVVLSYGRLDAAAARCAGLLRAHGVQPGDRVALIMPNVAYFPIAYYAILRLGAIVVPMNPLLKSGEIAYTWQNSGAKVAVVFAMFAAEAAKAAEQTGTDVIVVTPQEFEATLSEQEAVEEVVERADSDTAVILYTSGTTGKPKGAELSHRNLGTNVDAVLSTLFPMNPGDVVFGGLPLFHSFGQTVGLNSAIAGGACLDLLPKFDPAEALKMIEADGVTLFLGVPTMYVALLNTPSEADTSSLRLGASGGASLPVEVLNGVQRRFGFTLLEGYGLSETSPVASFNHPDRPAKPGSIGTPIRGCEMKLVNVDGNEVGTDEVGEIWVRGDNVMLGYFGDEAATAEATQGDWFRTGDMATRDADGFYFIVDRLKDMIIRNGFNVYPREIEEVLYTHPAVAEAAVFGVPRAEVGEEIAAKVTLKEGATATEDEIRQFVKDRVAAYKYPRIVVFGALPKGPTGKILKRAIEI